MWHRTDWITENILQKLQALARAGGTLSEKTNKWPPTLLRGLANLGFKRTRVSTGQADRIFVHRELKLVVKYAYVVGDMNYPPLMACPTIVLREKCHDNADENHCYQLVVQPRVRARSGAYGKLYDAFGFDARIVGADLKPRNSGMWDKQPVVFDW